MIAAQKATLKKQVVQDAVEKEEPVPIDISISTISENCHIHM